MLSLNPNWTNPTGSYRLGMKRAYELYPRQLISRVKEERKKKWMEVHKSIEAQIQKDMLQSTTKTGTDNIDIDELKTRMTQLRTLEKDMEDPGPLYDCLVFHDGDRWQAVLDTSETGDISDKLPMSEYRHAREYARFSEVDALNYCVNFFDNGSILSIVVDAGSHGSHVAGITAAYHPDQLELNGVAPGAQIISLKIGDSRLGSMETGVGLIRGLIEAVKRGCHIVNMSYGEATKWDNYGEYVKQAEVMVRKHGIVFVSSAGNNGPAISTVGCPGGTSSCCIGVGAFCTQSLMTAAYSMRKLMPESTYTWSSVGPTLDGDLGVSVMAPGGAVTSVPTWTGARSQLMNGTSMSSPNAAGCIALLLSAALTQNIKISSMNMKRIVENSAKMIVDVDVLGQGHGLLQVQSAWELILASKLRKWADVFYNIKIGSERFERGIYLRQPLEVAQANSFNVAVEPVFHEDFTAAQKTDYEVRFLLKSTASWVLCADKMLIVKGGKTVSLFVDPSKLPPGVHVAFVRGYEEAHEELGPQFEIPITIVRPEVIPDQCSSWCLENETDSDTDKKVVSFKPNERIRKFIVPPKGCTYIDAVLVDRRDKEVSATGQQAPIGEGNEEEGDGTARMVCLHALQLMRGSSYEAHEKQSYLNLLPGSQHVVSWPVVEGVTMEFCLARNWSTLESPYISVTLYFRGVIPSPTSLLLLGGQKVSPLVTVFNRLAAGPVDITPVGKLDKWTSVIKPSVAGKISPLGERDIMPGGEVMYQLIIEYEVSQTEAGDITCRFPGLQGALYESQFQSQFFMVFDKNKKLLGTGDFRPSPIKTLKGKHTVRIQIKHTQISVLESINEMTLLLERPIKTPINISFFKTSSETLIGLEKMKNRPLFPGGSVSFHWREPTHDQLPKAAVAGDYLSGTVTYLKKDNALLGNGTRPGGYKIQYTIADIKCAPPPTETPPAAPVPSTGDTKPIISNTIEEYATPPIVVEKSEDELKVCVKVFMPTPQVDSDKFISKIAYIAARNMGVPPPPLSKECGMVTAIKEAKIKYLKTLAGTPNFEVLYLTVFEEYPLDLNLKLVALAHFVKCKDAALVALKKTGNQELKGAALAAVEYVTVASKILTCHIDQNKVAAELGVNADKEDPAAVLARKESETLKAGLVEGYSAHTQALLDKIKVLKLSTELPISISYFPIKSTETENSINNEEKSDEIVSVIETITLKDINANISNEVDMNKSILDTTKDFEMVYKSLQKWEDLNTDKNWLLLTGNFKLKGKWGLVLKRVNELSSASADNKKGEVVTREILNEERTLCLEQLQWQHALADSKVWSAISNKEAYDAF